MGNNVLPFCPRSANFPTNAAGNTVLQETPAACRGVGCRDGMCGGRMVCGGKMVCGGRVGEDGVWREGEL